MKAEEMDDHEIIGQHFKQFAVTSSMMTKPEQDETMCNSSTDESSESIGMSIFSISSANLSGSCSVSGNKGSPNTICSDSESIYSIEDYEECEKIIDDESWNTDIGSASDDESDETKLESYCPLKNIESPIICSNNDILMQREGKQEESKTRPQNPEIGENPLMLNSCEKTDIANNDWRAAEKAKYIHNSLAKNVLGDSEITENHKGEIFSSNQFDSNSFQTNPLPSNSSPKHEDTSPQDAYKSSSEYSLLVSSSKEIIQSNLDKQMEENQNEIPDTTVTTSTKEGLLPSKSLLSRITTGLYIKSLKDKVETLSLIYNKFNHEITQRVFLQNISASKLSESINSSPTHSSLSESIRMDSTQLENQNIASEETNACGYSLVTTHNQKEKEKDALEPQATKKITCAFSECDNSRDKRCKSYSDLDTVKKEILINSCLQLPKNECSVSRDVSFQLQTDKLLDQKLAMKEKRNGFLGVNVREASMNTVIQHQEIENAEVLNNNGDCDTHISVSCTGSNYNTSVVCCDHCGKTSSNANHGKIIEMGTATTAETGNKCIIDAEIPSIDVFLQLFNTDNTLAKNILLAVSSEELTNTATYSNVIKYLRKKKLFSSKLLKDVKAFLQAAVDARVLKMKGKRYIFAERMDSSKKQHTQERKNKKERSALEKRILRKRVIVKEKKIQYNDRVKITPKKLSRVPKTKTKSRKF